MKNFVQCGDTLDLAAPVGGVVSGTPYLVGALFGIAAISAAAGETFTLTRVGVFGNLPKATHATDQAWAVGDLLYWDDTAKKLTKTALGNTLVAIATVAALSTAAVGTALLEPALAARALAAITALTDNSGGSATNTIAAIGGAYSQAEVANAVASLAAKINAILAAL